MNPSKVACLIATHNRPELLLRAYKSVVAQDYAGEVEIFIINDGGKWNPESDKRFPQAFILDLSTNQGPGACYNEALRQTDAEYICYLGDDDIFYPHHISTLVESLGACSDNDVAYSDLYKTYFDDGYTVVRKELEITRDFDRLKMLDFSHVLGGSIMHRRSLLEKTGPWSTDINCLYDFDMLRRMAFFTDFTHAKRVTGEYWQHVNTSKSDRISKNCRRNMEQHNQNIIHIRNRMPAKMEGWKIGKVAICIEAEKWSRELIDTLLFINASTFWPYLIILKMPEPEYQKHASKMDLFHNITSYYSGDHSPTFKYITQSNCKCDYICHVPFDEKFSKTEVAWIERALLPLSKEPESNYVAYQCPDHPGIYVKRVGHTECIESKTDQWQWPFNFDHYNCIGDTLFEAGNFIDAEKNYKSAAVLGNPEWMARRITACKLRQKDYEGAYTHLVEAQRYPNIETLRLAHEYCTGTNDIDGANECKRQIDLINSVGTM